MLDSGADNLGLHNQYEFTKAILDMTATDGIVAFVDMHGITLPPHHYDSVAVLKNGEIYALAVRAEELTGIRHGIKVDNTELNNCRIVVPKRRFESPT